MGIILRTPWGRIPLTGVDLSTSDLLDLKEKIQEDEHIAPWQQRLFYNGQELEYNSDRCLADYNIQEDSEITLTLPPPKQTNSRLRSLKVLAEMHELNKMICRKCYCQLPSTATRCRHAKCGRTTNIRPKKTRISGYREYWPSKLFDKKNEWGYC